MKWMKMYFLLNMGIFQPVMLVCRCESRKQQGQGSGPLDNPEDVVGVGRPLVNGAVFVREAREMLCYCSIWYVDFCYTAVN